MITNSSVMTTNSSLQAISTIDMAVDRFVRYNIDVSGNGFTQTSTVDITHNGYDVSETQWTLSCSNTSPVEFSVMASGNSVGKIVVAPNSNSSIFTIQKDSLQTPVYGSHTLPGRLILANTGFGVWANSSLSLAVVRYPGENFFGEDTTYSMPASRTYDKMAFGPTLITTNWQPYNGCTYESNTYVSSGQDNNFIYQVVNTTPGDVYSVIYDLTPIENGAVSLGQGSPADFPSIFVANALDSRPLDNMDINLTTALVNSALFVATTEQTIVGIGKCSSRFSVTINQVAVKRGGPIPTYQHSINGNYYVKWNAIPASTDVIRAVSIEEPDTYSSVLTINSSNSVVFGSIDCGPQQPVNRVVLSSNSIVFNGTTLTGDAPIPALSQITLATDVLAFSYVPSVLTTDEAYWLISNG